MKKKKQKKQRVTHKKANPAKSKTNILAKCKKIHAKNYNL